MKQKSKMFSKLTEKTSSLLNSIQKRKNLINKMLPVEILLKIFMILQPQDLKSVVLVCKRWKEVGDDPYLWMWAMVTVKKDSLEDIPSFLSTKRMRLLKTIGLRAVSNNLLQAITIHPGLRTLDMHANLHTDLSNTDPNILANALGRLESVSIFKAHLTKKQQDALMAKLISGSSIKNLNIGDTDLSVLDPQIFSNAMTRVETLGLYWTELTKEQLTALLSKVLEGSILSNINIFTDVVVDKDLSRLVAEKIGKNNFSIRQNFVR